MNLLLFALDKVQICCFQIEENTIVLILCELHSSVKY